MKDIIKKRVIKILSFIVVLWLVLACANHVFRFKYINGVLNTELFYEEEKDSIDVLIMGSSHAWAAIAPSILWEKYGIAAYDMGGPEQPIWCSYYYLKEALKYQSPQLLVLEVYSLTEESDVATPMQITRNVNGMRWSVNKLQCLLESVEKEEFLDYCFEYVQYHSRYKEIERKDFTTNYGSVLYDHHKGFYGREETVAFEMHDVKGITERESLLGKNEEYYRRIIELAQENGIQVCVVVSPYAGITVTHKNEV